MKTNLETPNATVKAPLAWVKWLLAAWVVGSLLFAHGCHGPNEDHELFTSFTSACGIAFTGRHASAKPQAAD